MPQKRDRRFIFWLLLVILLAVFFETTGYLAMKLNSRRGDFLSNQTYFRIRDMLMGNSNPETYPKYLSQPYLAYIPYPGYARNGQQEHNLAGYRGKQVPLVKDGNYRILCMGGSTTYGFKLPRWQQSYPAQVDSILNNWFARDSVFHKKYRGIEVINAGLEAGTSAEELAQYQFKYHYYQPDLLVLATGLNDALIPPSDTLYQPDYTHYRRMDFNVKPLPGQSAWMLKSYFLSYIIIKLFYDDFANPAYYFEQDGTAKFARWDKLNTDSLLARRNYSYYAFPHNFKLLVGQAALDSMPVLFVPAVLNPYSPMVKENDGYRSRVAFYNVLMQQAATGSNVYLNFTADSLDYEHQGLDDCHLTAEGEHNKAAMIARKISSIIKARTGL